MGTSSAPNNQFEDLICLDDLFNDGDYFKDIQSFINHPPTPTPTPTPTQTQFSLPSSRPNDETSGPCFTREDQLHSSSRSQLGLGGDNFSKQVLVLECGAAAAALSQGGPIATSTHSLPPLTPQKHKTRKQRTNSQKIRAEDLKIHFDKKRADAAKCLHVSISTLKRKARESGIACWPFNKSKNKAMSAKIVDESLLSPACSSYVVVDPVSSMQLESEISSPPKQLGIETTTEKEEKPMIVKVKYRDDCVKFEMFSASKADLEKETSKRLKLKVGSFKMKYLDEEEDLISITCDADLQLCKRSLGKEKNVKMMVLPSPT